MKHYFFFNKYKRPKYHRNNKHMGL